MNGSLGYISLGLNITHYLHNLKIKEISLTLLYPSARSKKSEVPLVVS